MNKFFTTHLYGNQSDPVRDMYAEGTRKKSSMIAVAGGGNDDLSNATQQQLDVSWLTGAAEEYNISPDIRDYLLVPVVTIVSKVPNTNGDAMDNAELLRFNTLAGRPAYKTFIGKPTYSEHQNNLILRAAKGVIFDAYVRSLPRYPGLLKVCKLLGFDRTKDANLTQRIRNRRQNTYSMGVNFAAYRCTISGRLFGTEDLPGEYTKPGQAPYIVQTAQGPKLSYRLLCGLTGFETSAVEIPAYFCALQDTILDARTGQFYAEPDA